MEFQNDQPIYLQIYHRIAERILSGAFAPESRIPSVRDFAAEVGVNPNTVMRSFERLTSDGIIYQKRGMGYFVSADAPQRILELERKDFLEHDLPLFKKKMKMLGLELDIFAEGDII